MPMSRRSRWLLLGATCALLTPVPVSAAPQVEEHRVPLGDRTVRALCTEGPRRVILLHGNGGGEESWRPVLRRLEDRGFGACAYERPMPVGGEGSVRGWFELLDEMRRIHEALGIEPGYTLVGQGVGGMYARLYAADRPRDVGGLVLVDPVHEDMPQEARAGMPAAAWSEWMTRRSVPNADGLREIDLARHARESRLPDIPVTVLTATDRESGPGWDVRFVAEAARRAHASLLRGIRSGRHIPAQGSGPSVHVDDPGLVAEEISAVARTTTWSSR